MKMMLIVAMTFPLFFADASSPVATRFGPSQCVSLSRSPTGSCVLSTDCDRVDISKTEFAFDCVGKDDSVMVRHSFGKGGFDAREEFDTEVKCDRCEPVSMLAAAPAKKARPAKKKARKIAKVKQVHAPKPTRAKIELAPENIPASVLVAAKSRARTKAASKAKTKSRIWPFTSWTKKQPDVVKYGPDGCVSTYKSEKSGHCIMRTNCAKTDISNYEFGLVCVDKTGSPVRHLFGKGSFDQEETFDTLIKCDQCLGLEDVPDEVAINGELTTMARDISELKDSVKTISGNVKLLNAAVFKAAPAPAPAPAEADPATALAAAAPAAAALVAHHREVNAEEEVARKHNLRQKRMEEYAEEDGDAGEDDGRYDVTDDDTSSSSDASKSAVSSSDGSSDHERPHPWGTEQNSPHRWGSAVPEAKKEEVRERDDDDEDGEDGED